MIGLPPPEYRRRLRKAYAFWKANRRIFYVSPRRDFETVVAALEQCGLMRKESETNNEDIWHEAE